MNILFIIIISFFIAEFCGWFYHRYVAHLGLGGDAIRIPHYCHHNIIYPTTNLESKKYKTAYDLWPWLLLILIVFSIAFI